MCDLVHVVDDEDDVVRQRGLQRVAQMGSEQLRPIEFVLRASERGHELIRRDEVRTERIGYPRGDNRELSVPSRSGIPRALELARPARKECRLAEARAGREKRQALPERLVEALLESRSLENDGCRSLPQALRHMRIMNAMVEDF